MFTGLIQKVGRLAGLEGSGAGVRAVIMHDPWDEPIVQGESVAVQGICLTVVRVESKQFVCDVLDETLRRTNLKTAVRKTPVNLERALRMGDRLGGHFVTGHVDGTGTVRTLREAGKDHILGIDCDTELIRQVVLKGSVACDGVSLTVTAVSKTGFEVNLIPFTWQSTSLPRLKLGDTVNLETDLIGKYVQRYQIGDKPGSNLTLAQLRDAGFA